jgi:hypothetical protein
MPTSWFNNEDGPLLGVWMTESQIALYGGSLLLGPIFLGGYLLLYWWFQNGPITERGRRKMRAQQARNDAEWAERRKEWASQDTSHHPPQ